MGKGSASVTVEEDDVKDLEIVVSAQTPPTVVEEAPVVQQPVVVAEPVSYTHLTLPTNREV